MRRFLIICFMLSAFGLMAQDKTLRVDYIFSGTDKTQEISLDEMSCFDGWAGRRCNTDSVAVRGNGQISLTNLCDRQGSLPSEFLDSVPGVADNGRSDPSAQGFRKCLPASDAFGSCCCQGGTI